MPADALQRLRQKYPGYSDIPDQELARRIIQKYPDYQDILGDIAAGPRPAVAPTVAPALQQPVGFGGRVRQIAETVLGKEALNPEVLGDVAALVPIGAGVGLAGRAILRGLRTAGILGRAAPAVETAAGAVARQLPLLEEAPQAVSGIGRVIRGAGQVARAGQEAVTDIAGSARALLTSFDLSGPRQGIATLPKYPKQFARAFVQQFRYFADPETVTALRQEIVSRPTFQQMARSGLDLSGVTGRLISQGEEAFARAHLAESLPLGVGKIVKASETAYTGFLTKLRADVFDRMLADTRRILGREVTDVELKSIGKGVNTLTGRGHLGALEPLGGELSTTLFAPRTVASRLNLLDIRGLVGKGYYASLEPVVRRQVAESALGLAGLIATTGGLAKASGLEVGMNPLSADFGKLMVPQGGGPGALLAKSIALFFGVTNSQVYGGKERYDLTHGFGFYVRVAAQAAMGERTSTTTGKTRPVEPEGVLATAARSKAAPIPSFALKILRRQEPGGGAVNVPRAVLQTFVPIFIQDVQSLVSTPTEGRQPGQSKRGLEFWPPRLR